MNIRNNVLKVERRGILSGKLAFAIASFGFSLILFFTFVAPEYKHMQSLEIENVVKTKNIKEKNDTLTNILEFKKSIENVSASDLEKVKVFIPDDDKIEFQLSNIDNLRKSSRLSLFDVSVSETASKKGAKKATEEPLMLQGKEVKKSIINFTVGGDFSGIVSFINSLERTIPFTNIQSLEILTDKKRVVDEATKESVEVKSISSKISLEVYHY